jgi:hypothetical protein
MVVSLFMFVLWRNYLHNQATVQKRQIMEHDIKSCWGQSSHLTRYDGQIFCQNMCLMSGQRTYMHNVTRIMHWIVFLGINCQCGVDLIDGDECVIGWTNHTGTMVKTPQKTSIASKYYKYMYQHVCWFTQGNLWWYLCLLDCEGS